MNKCRNHCNDCEQETWHEVASHVEVEHIDQMFGDHHQVDAEILKCCGCDLFSFKLVTHPFDWQEDKKPEVLYLPERSHKRRKRKYFGRMPKTIQALYVETVEAHNNQLGLLSAVGMRALLESIIVDKIDKSEYDQSIESKINALSKHFEEKTITTLHEFRVAGNKAIHSNIAPDHRDVHAALRIIESIMEFFYGVSEHVEGYHSAKKFRTTIGQP
jgi:hypothetical protein